MKIGNLGEYETRIALRVLDCVAFGPLNSRGHHLRAVTGHSLHEFQRVARNTLDGDLQQLAVMSELALKFALNDFPRYVDKSLERWTNLPPKRLVRIHYKLRNGIGDVKKRSAAG